MNLSRGITAFTLGVFLALAVCGYCFGGENVQNSPTSGQEVVLVVEQPDGQAIPNGQASPNGGALTEILSQGDQQGDAKPSEINDTCREAKLDAGHNTEQLKALVASILAQSSAYSKLDTFILVKPPLFLERPDGLAKETTFLCERLTPVLNGKEVQFLNDDRIKLNNIDMVSSKYWAYLEGVITTKAGERLNVKLLIDVQAIKVVEVRSNEGHVVYLAYMVSEDFFFLWNDSCGVKAGSGEFKPLYLAKRVFDKNRTSVEQEAGKLVGFMSVSVCNAH